MDKKHIIFDIGNVVLEWQPEHILRTVFGVADTEELLQKTFLSPEWKAYDHGVMTTKELKEQLALNLRCSVMAIESLLQNVVVALRPVPDVVELIQQLKQHGYICYALSNMPVDVFHSLFEEHGFWHLFDDIIISGQVKMSKPEPEIFKFVLDKHNLTAEQCIFLDDSKANVDAADKLGFTTIKVINPQQAIDELSVLVSL